MEADAGAGQAFVSVLVAALSGLACSVGIERWLRPRPRWDRPLAAWALHAGLCLVVQGVCALLLGRPWFAAAGVSAFLLMLVLVNNAKYAALREPFVFQDYEYFTDAIRHPRLYIPFLGWGKFLAATLGFVAAVSVGLWLEVVPASGPAWAGHLQGSAIAVGMGSSLLMFGHRVRLPVCFDPGADIVRLGFLANLWRYAGESAVPPREASPFEGLSPCRPSGDLPHLLAVQSESFFDPRPLYSGIRKDVLAEFDRLKNDSIAHGKLRVPAWGANTVRTEFAFLSGIGQESLGGHRFNPYRAISAGWDVASLSSYLKSLGYRTVCIHPYPASFYLRSRVFPRLGFDQFIDIDAFHGAKRFGPYVSDLAVADKVCTILSQADQPVFVFVITMENHGPLHLERSAPADVEAGYVAPPPEGCDDLTIYLRHLRNADQMIKQLRQWVEKSERPASLCWFGDHVPIMPSVYRAFGAPPGDVEYVIFGNQISSSPQLVDRYAYELSLAWLEQVGLIATGNAQLASVIRS